MPLILGTNSIKDTAYNVANSVRLNAADNPSGSVTQGTPTNVDKYTFSVWVKRADLGAGNSKIFSVTSGGTYGEEKLEFNNDDLIWRQTEPSAGNTNWERVTDRKFRDLSAWYHIVVAYDSSQGTASNRCKMYINGVEETSFSGSSNPSSNQDSYTNTSGRALKFFALHSNTSSQNAGAYFAEMVYVDGQQLDPTSFGEFDEDSPTIWKPIDVSGLTFGNNGFYLDFEDSSALGNDVSGNNNDVTFSNIASTDQSTDTCTNNAPILLTFPGANTNHDGRSEGNLVSTSNTSQYAQPFSSIAINSGKFYFEMKYTALSGTNTNSGMGIIESDTLYHAFYNSDANSFYYSTDGQKVDSGSASSYGNSQSAGDIVQCAFDATNGAIWFGKNGTWQNSATQSEIEAGTTTNAAFTSIPSGFYVAGFCDATASKSFTVEFNFGSPPYSISSGNSDGNGYGNFEYAVPSGFYALNTKNLAEFG